MSLTQLINSNKEVRDFFNNIKAKKKEFHTESGKEAFSKEYEEKVPYNLDNRFYSILIGTAFDFIARFEIARAIEINKDALYESLINKAGVYTDISAYYSLASAIVRNINSKSDKEYIEDYELYVKKFEVENTENNEIVVDKKGVVVYGLLFLLCIGCVLHILNYIYLFVIVSVVMAIYNRKLFLKVDYILLLTFVFFFVFIGNLSNMESIKTFLENIIDGKELFIGAFLSQFISNVPATILLSKFTENYKQLLYGVDIGGLGTLIGSMASLISYKFYSQEDGADTKKYIKDFSIYNFSLFIILIVFAIFV